MSVVETCTFAENVSSSCALLKNGWGILLQGQNSSGKTLVANELARIHNAKMKTINVDDTFDSKDLLGKFSATDVPGVFEWVAGPVTEAVTKGQWLLMEDIDLASFDVFSVLLPLITSGTLFLADKGKTLEAHPSFRLIVTQQLMELGSGNCLSAKKMNSIPNVESWPTVIIKSPTTDEKLQIVSSLYPSVPLEPLTSLLEKIPSRYCVLRDILKWSQRVFKQVDSQKQGGFLSSTTREMLFQEAYDCFCAGFPLSAERETLIAALASCCGVPAAVATSMINERKPQLNITREVLQIGRVTLPMAGPIRKREAVVAFAETKQSMSLMERIACSVGNNEPVLLTGETGVGKTFLVQYLADNLGQSLIVHNLNQQTDSSDFMGGWKPRDMSQQIRILFNKFVPLFKNSFNWQKNSGFLDSVSTAVEHRNWDAALVQFEKGCKAARSALLGEEKADLLEQWNAFGLEVKEVDTIVQTAKTSFLFVFEEGTLVKAWREGHWILLDEVNLASTEVLERVASVLGGSDTLVVTERGSTEEVPRHPNFRVFANMNPPTDVGKKDLPPSLRSRFTEFYVPDPFDRHDLTIVVSTYLEGLSPDSKVNEIVNFFLECVSSARSSLCDLDGESKPPHFSLRSLTRALTYIRKATSMYGFNTSILDGLMMGFASPLQRKFHSTIHAMIVRIIFYGRAPGLATLPKQPPGADPSKRFIPYEHIWLELGPVDPFINERFILTHTVKDHLKNIARAVFTKRPVLLEGPTSAGKSSMVQYLAEMTGHRFVRINNHESTEIQEYLGHYVSDENGKLRFVDGCLTAAVRHGHWVVLDELNLAPTEVLEALNRLLDDNCELFIPDTQETVQPHPSLRIFATQNPSGIYGGRKALSRAFRNRFLEVIVDDIPTKEIQEILCKRYSMPPKFAEKMVEVMTMLQIRRQSSHLFAGRHGYITPRDLFRWADRHAMDYQTLAEHGYLLLGERCRKSDEKRIVKDVIEKCMHVMIEDNIYDPTHWEFTAKYFKLVDDVVKDKIVWTPSMQRLFTIVGLCLEHKEPVLLVGETGSSKTTICQIWATVLNQPLQIVNCHQHSEASDFLGSLRPTPQDQESDSLFAWQDGPLVRSMRRGDIFVLDEISLAEDSVLERLNSVLEPSRTLTLAEKSSGELLTADEAFRFLATMNPGGDFGKKELSPALRNRFTEVYVQPIVDQIEIAQIISKRLPSELHGYASHMARLLLAVAERKMDSVIHISIRDVIAWADFMTVTHERCDPDVAFWHGLDAILLDGLSVGGGVSESSVESIRATCLSVAKTLVPQAADTLKEPFWNLCTGTSEPVMPTGQEKRFFFGAPTTKKNASKLVRASVLKKAVMLEGSPGVGKTSIVEALGAAFDKVVVRINLSEQTDMMDLLGAFLPCAATSEGPAFEWSDGILLGAVKSGHWVILDELNLASQSVLEGLNALLDHRSTIFLPELCKEVTAHPDFRLFACQNPLVEGGGRKGLPKSFLNRFTKVRVAPFTFDDLMCISTTCTNLPETLVRKMVTFVCKLQEATMELRTFGSRGSPWEFNLRDVLRWSKLMIAANHLNPRAFADMLFFQRFRTNEDKNAAVSLYNTVFEESSGSLEFVNFQIKDGVILGESIPIIKSSDVSESSMPLLLPSQTANLNSVLWCASSNQFCSLVGPAASGKSSILSLAAKMTGSTLDVFSMTAGCDTMDLLGGFDQVEGRQGSFEWRDSVILTAMIEGHWVVLDNANFCSASVLDRLNSLVEPNGVLVVNEQGLVGGEVRVVRPHPNFRLFATMDPKFGEMSRALRNRSVELFIAPPAIPSQEASIIACNVSPTSLQPLVDNINLFHKQFVQLTAFADTSKPFEGRLVDALSSGAPTLATMLRALKLSSGEGGALQALFSTYIRNRSGIWAVHREKVEEYLHSLNFDSVHSILCNNALMKASKLFPGDLETALLLVGAFRAALVFYIVKNSDAHEDEASWDGALMHFVSNSRGLGELAASIIDELTDIGVPIVSICGIMSLLANEDSPLSIVVRSDVTIGRSARALCLPFHSSVPSNVAEAVDALFKVVSTQFDLNMISAVDALKLLAYVRPILLAFHGRELTPTTKAMLPLLTYVTLILKVSFDAGDDSQIRQAAEVAFSALRRYANLAGDMAPPPKLLVFGQPLARDVASLASHEAEEMAEEVFCSKRAAAENSLYPLWRQAASRKESMIMSKLMKSLLEEAPVDLKDLLCSFDLAFTGKVPLLLKGTMAGVAGQLTRRPEERLAAIGELVSRSSFRKQESSLGLISGAWIGSACKALRLANAATLGDFCDFSRSTTSQALSLLRSSLDNSVLCPIDSVGIIKEWLSSDILWLLSVLDESGEHESLGLEKMLVRVEATCKDKRLKKFKQQLQCIISVLEDESSDLISLLRASIIFHTVRCQLLTPTSFVDPMLSYQLGKHTSQGEVSYWKNVLSIIKQGDYVSYGLTQASLLTKTVEGVAKEFKDQDTQMEQKYTPRPDETGVRFVELVSTQKELCEGLLGEDRLSVCTRFLEASISSSSPVKKNRSEAGIVSREEVDSWCQLLRTSANELYHRFKGYEDFILPFAQSLTLISFFTEVGLQAIPSDISTYLQGDEAASLIQFPCPRPVLVSPPLDITDRFGDLMKLLDSMLIETRIQACSGTCDPTPLFDSLAHVYAAVDELNRSENHQDELAVMYKEKAIVIEGDDEKNIRKLKEMFPEYEKEFDDLDKEVQEGDENEDADSRNKKMGRTARILFNGDNGQRLRKIPIVHREIYQLLTLSKESTDGSTNKMSSFETRFDAVASLQRGAFICHSDDEAKSISGCLARAKVLQQKIADARPVTASDIDGLISSSFNIYLDCVPSESAMVAKCLNDLSMSVQKLVFEYPENVTLIRVMKIIKRLQEYPAFSTPLMRIVTATEILLRECYEWERNASREVSIMSHINALSGCVLRWRRMELHCWPHIFVAKENEFTTRASSKWFELYRYCKQVSSRSEEFDPNRTFAFASDFMWTCCVGEFDTRRKMLESFGTQLIHEHVHDDAVTCGTIFLHISGFFSQFCSVVNAAVESVRAPLKEDLEEFCRIMRWEDATYYAVRSSTQRSHLKVSRVLIQLEEGLRQPVLQVIAKHEEDTFQQNMGFSMNTAPIKDLAKKQGKSTSKGKNNGVDKPKKRSRKGELIDDTQDVSPEDTLICLHKQHWSCGDIFTACEYLDSTRDNIVERMMALQAPKVPQNQKSRALKLLFESTEEAGIPQTHEATLPEWHVLFSAGALPPGLLTEQRLLRSEFDSSKASDLRLHFYKLSRIIQKMRDCQRTPHTDITVGQVNRGTGMAETLFADVAFLNRGLSELCTVKDGLASLKMAIDKSSTELNLVFRNSACFVRQSRSLAMWLASFVDQSEWLESNSDLHFVATAAKELLSFSDQYFYRTNRAGYELSQVEYAQLQHCLSKCEGALSTLSTHKGSIASHAIEFISDIKKIRASPVKIVSPDCAWRDSVTTLLSDIDDLFQALPPSSPIFEKSQAVSGGELEEEESFPSSDPVVKNGREAYATILLNVSSAKASLQKLITQNNAPRTLAVSDRNKLMARIIKLISVVDSMLFFLSKWCESVSHFSMIIAKVMIALMKNGFCKSEEEEDDQDGEGGTGESKEGTGMDDGKGEKDVTDELENEDQLMNMKDKEQQENDDDEGDGEDKDKAAEVETDFQADKEERSDDEEDGDEDGEDSEAEMGSVDEEHQQERKKSRKEKDDPDMNNDEGGDAEEVPEDDLAENKEKNGEEEGEDEETKDYGNKEKEIRDAQSDDEKDEDNAELLGDNESQQFSGDDDSAKSASDDEDKDQSDADDKSVANEEDDEGSDDDGVDKDKQMSGENSDEEPDRQDEAETENPNAAEDGDAQSTDSDDSEVDDEKAEMSKIKDQNSQFSGEQDDEAGDEKVDDKQQKTEKHDDAAGEENEEQTGNEQEKNDAGRSWKKKDQNEQSQKSSSDQKKQTNDANPMKALKEAMKRHTQKAKQLNLDRQVKLNEDNTEENDNPQNDDNGVDDDDDFEIHEKGADEGMAPTDDVNPSLADASLQDQAKDSDEENEDAGDDANDTDAPQDKKLKRKKEDTTEIEEGESNEKDSKKDKDKKKNKKIQLTAKDANEETASEEESDEVVVDEALDAKAQRGRDLWYETEAVVAGHAQSLCEQLRLILAPTQADKLQGDYKTGKRINIKKIIPYIASQFKKDRIWLRRTKPNKRSYQVLIALDDSLSMLKNNAGVVSCQAVALLSKAMQQLEVGEFGILRFGKETSIVHPLVDAFGADSGPRAFSEFTFEQQSTSMKTLLETSLDYMDLEKSRLGSSIRSTTQTLRQMLFIVSDGQITEDRAALRKLLARAEENGQAVVLLILDIAAYDPTSTPDASPSAMDIAPSSDKPLSLAEKMRKHNAARDARLKKSLKGVLDMQVVEFQGNKVLKKAYLEDFPFPFYIVVQDIPSLPTMLADAMRQWFELLANGH